MLCLLNMISIFEKSFLTSHSEEAQLPKRRVTANWCLCSILGWIWKECQCQALSFTANTSLRRPGCLLRWWGRGHFTNICYTHFLIIVLLTPHTRTCHQEIYLHHSCNIDMSWVETSQPVALTNWVFTPFVSSKLMTSRLWRVLSGIEKDEPGLYCWYFYTFLIWNQGKWSEARRMTLQKV